jgi:hypothetical protein
MRYIQRGSNRDNTIKKTIKAGQWQVKLVVLRRKKSAIE